MRVTICDRCGDIITGNPQGGPGGVAEASAVKFIERPSLNEDATTMEMCNDCFMEVKAAAKVRVPEPVRRI